MSGNRQACKHLSPCRRMWAGLTGTEQKSLVLVAVLLLLGAVTRLWRSV